MPPVTSDSLHSIYDLSCRLVVFLLIRVCDADKEKGHCSNY